MKNKIIGSACFVTMSLWAPAWNIATYNNLSPLVLHHSRTAIDQLSLKGNEKILHLACRDGSTSLFLAKEKVPHGFVRAVDATLSLVKDISYPHNLVFEAHSLIEHYQEKFDCIICLWEPHWIENIAPLLASMYSNLQDNGTALITCILNGGSLLDECVKKILTHAQWSSYSHDFIYPLYTHSLEKIIATIKTAQLSIHSLRITENSDTYANTTELKKTLAALPVTSCIPAEKKDDFFNDVITMFIAHPMAKKDNVLRNYGTVITALLKKNTTSFHGN